MEALKEVRMSPDQRRLVLKAIDDIDDQQTATLDLHDFKNLFQNIDSRCQPGTPQKRCKCFQFESEPGYLTFNININHLIANYPSRKNWTWLEKIVLDSTWRWNIFLMFLIWIWRLKITLTCFSWVLINSPLSIVCQLFNVVINWLSFQSINGTSCAWPQTYVVHLSTIPFEISLVGYI